MYAKPIAVMAALLLMSTAAIAQNAQPDPNPPVPNRQATPMATAPSASAMPVDKPRMETGQFLEEQREGQALATDLMGQEVLDSNGQQIAEISDLIVAQDRRIVGVVLATGGFLGIGEHNVAVELNQLTPNPDADGYVVALSRDAIEAAPDFQTLDQVRAVRDAEMMREQQGATPAPAVPAPTTSQ